MVNVLIVSPASKNIGAWEQQLGNAAILIPTITELKQSIADIAISTTVQLSENFCKEYGIKSLRNDSFWKISRSAILGSLVDLLKCSLWRMLRKTLKLNAEWLIKGVKLNEYTKADVILDVSGDTYSDDIPWYILTKHSAELLAMRLLRKPVIIFAASPGPFYSKPMRLLAKFTLNRMTLITTREQLSNDYLQKIGVRKELIVTTVCPAFLLEPAPKERSKEILELEGIDKNDRPLIGITLAGYNLYSYRSWEVPPSLEDLSSYAPVVKYLLDDVKAHVILIPHVYRTNQLTGEHIQGPDYKILKHLYQLVDGDKYNGRIRLIEGTYASPEIKGIIGQLDLFITGRLHAGIAALSQAIPTVLLAYGRKHHGVAQLLGQENYVCSGSDPEKTLAVARDAWNNRAEISMSLQQRLVNFRELANLNFEIVKAIVDLDKKERPYTPQEIVAGQIKRVAL